MALKPIVWKPWSPVAKIKGRLKQYICCLCNKQVAANECYYTGLLMDVTRDPQKFACKKHIDT